MMLADFPKKSLWMDSSFVWTLISTDFSDPQNPPRVFRLSIYIKCLGNWRRNSEKEANCWAMTKYDCVNESLVSIMNEIVSKAYPMQRSK